MHYAPSSRALGRPSNLHGPGLGAAGALGPIAAAPLPLPVGDIAFVDTLVNGALTAKRMMREGNMEIQAGRLGRNGASVTSASSGGSAVAGGANFEIACFIHKLQR